LRRALDDDNLEILYWVPEEEAYVDSLGHAGSPFASDGRVVVPVTTANGQPLAAIRVDQTMRRHQDLLNAAVTAAALALENARLQASVRAQLEQVRASRTRILEAGLAARRRVEQDLHDGAQQRLLALKLNLATAKARTLDPAARTAIDNARAELQEALTELRDLAHGIHPAVLTQAGLAAAIEGVAERFPLPVDVDVSTRRWSEALESTVYFLVSEALTNTAKHADATRTAVTVRPDGPDLLVEVTDDGIGGASFEPGIGLAGMRDRVAALGGVMTLTSPSGAGTRVTARIPCG